MISERPEIEDGFLFIDLSEDGVDPPFLVEMYEGGAVRNAWSYATKREALQGIVDWGLFFYGGTDGQQAH